METTRLRSGWTSRCSALTCWARLSIYKCNEMKDDGDNGIIWICQISEGPLVRYVPLSDPNSFSDGTQRDKSGSNALPSLTTEMRTVQRNHLQKIKSKGDLSPISPVIAIVFDVTDNQTLANAKNWLNDAREVNGSFSTPFPPPVFLIGTKKDLLVSQYTVFYRET